MTYSARKPYPVFFSYVGYLIFSLLLSAAVLELGSALVLAVFHWIRPDTREVTKVLSSSSPAYGGYSWASEYWKEERLRWSANGGHVNYVPFLVWGERPWHSQYINVDETLAGNLRRTTNPACDQGHRTVVWMFGGSTLFGLGVPDEATIPSYLSRELNSKSSACFVVSNLGVEGYLTNQELIRLVEQLKKGQRPDMVIFYDGVNEAHAAVSPGIPDAHLEFASIKSRVEGTLSSKLDFLRSSSFLQIAGALARRLGHGGSGDLPPSQVSARAAAALDNYEANISVVKRLGQIYNFKVYCFWQPSLASGRKPLVPFERSLWDLGPGHPVATPQRIMLAVNEEAARRSAQNDGFIFLGRVFDDVKEPLFIDALMHIGPLGNQIVANAIARRVDAR